MGESDARQIKGWLLAVIAIKKWLGIEGIDVRGAAFHEQEDDSFCSSTQWRLLWGEWIRLRQHGRESKLAEADSASFQQLASVQQIS